MVTLLPDVFSRWVTDRLSRKPSGWMGRLVYKDRSVQNVTPLVLEWIRPAERDSYCEIGQGGGLLLREMLRYVGKAAALDHSRDMVELASANNRAAIEEGRLRIDQGDALNLPWPDGSFTCGASVAVLLFLSEPERFMQEVARVLAPGGRFVLITPGRRSLDEGRKAGAAHGIFLHGSRFFSEEEIGGLVRGAGLELTGIHWMRHLLASGIGKPINGISRV
ncbi:MAG: class I SAM-dependent methyltransferase [Synergistales bacterium]|nr:class I SAM-dependent methyltransferase [Synergistales bacterium]